MVLDLPAKYRVAQVRLKHTGQASYERILGPASK